MFPIKFLWSPWLGVFLCTGYKYWLILGTVFPKTPKKLYRSSFCVCRSSSHQHGMKQLIFVCDCFFFFLFIFYINIYLWYYNVRFRHVFIIRTAKLNLCQSFISIAITIFIIIIIIYNILIKPFIFNGSKSEHYSCIFKK